MGSLGLDSPKLGAFQSDTFPRGLDLGRSTINRDSGVYRAAEASDFEAGMLLAQDVDGNLAKCVGTPAMGVAKWNKTNVLSAVSVDETVSFPAPNAVINLKHSNVSNVQVRSLADGAGTVYTVTTDYTVSAVNGTLTHVGAGAIPTATTVFASYTYQLSAKELEFQGRNFFNFTDDVSIAEGHVTVITQSERLFTSQFDSAQVYTLTGVGANLYCGGGATAALAGLFTNDAAEGDFVGRVIQLPSADDPFLGVRFNEGLVEIP